MKQGNDISSILDQVPHILIVDDKAELCLVLEQFMINWHFEPESVNNPLLVADVLDRRFCNVVLLDIRMPQKSGIELIPEIREQSPDSKIIFMTGYADKETVIQALRLGAFDFLEKPFDKDLLFHAVKRSLNSQRTELEFRRAYEELKRKKEELLYNEAKLTEANKQLMETNNALSVLAQNIERTRKETEFQISKKVRASIMPLFEKFSENKLLNEYRVELDVLMDFMDDLLTDLSSEPQIGHLLSPTEFRVAALIKNGLTTDDIAKHMYISPCTVKSHRRSIRKKLNLNHSSRNLKTYLKSKFEALGVEEGREMRG
jgi:DNA-binding NarL/FixJ family response regulator